MEFVVIKRLFPTRHRATQVFQLSERDPMIQVVRILLGLMTIHQNLNFFMNLLLTWLTTEGNYSRYEGGDGQKGETKIALAKDLSQMMTKSGCIIERTPKQIANKINELVRSYRDAIASKNSTGQQHL